MLHELGITLGRVVSKSGIMLLKASATTPGPFVVNSISCNSSALGHFCVNSSGGTSGFQVCIERSLDQGVLIGKHDVVSADACHVFVGRRSITVGTSTTITHTTPRLACTIKLLDLLQMPAYKYNGPIACDVDFDTSGLEGKTAIVTGGTLVNYETFTTI